MTAQQTHKKLGAPIKHGMDGTRVYRTWVGMKERCYRVKGPRYDIYGGRGISVCDEWKNDFVAFWTWAKANGYTDKLTIDRIDNDLGYCPENCRFLTRADNNRNRRCVKLSFELADQIRSKYLDGDITYLELSKQYGIHKATVGNILRNETWIRTNQA